MSNEEKETRERIHTIALAEFQEKGFRDASLRSIVKAAGVTTGSFYWYYKSKEVLFDALVGAHYDHIMQMYQDSLDAFWELSKDEQKEHMGEIGGECMAAMLEYMYQHKAAFQILIDGASGTKYENMLHELTEREIQATHAFSAHMQEIGIEGTETSPELEHIIVSGMFAGLFELVSHNIPVDTARVCARQLHDFYAAGWSYLLNVPVSEKMTKNSVDR